MFFLRNNTLIRLLACFLICCSSNSVWGIRENNDSLLLLSHKLDSIAEYNYEIGNDSVAIELCTQSLRIRGSVLGEKHPLYAKSLSHLSHYYYEQGRYSEAKEYVSEAIKIQKEAHREKNNDYAESLLILASIHSTLGDFRTAIKLGKESVIIEKELFGSESVEYACTLGNLASLYFDFGNTVEAEKLNKEALNIYNALKKVANSDYATLLINLAKCRSILDDNKAAIELGFKAAVIFRDLYGIKNPSYAITMGCIALFYANLGNYKEAYRIDNEVLDIYEEVYGKCNPNYITQLMNVAEDCCDLRKYDESLSLVIKAADISKNDINNRQVYAEAIEKMSRYYLAVGDYKNALVKAKEALEYKADIYGTNHFEYAYSLRNIANCCYETGDYESALYYGLEALKIREGIYGLDVQCAHLLDELSYSSWKLGYYENSYLYGKNAVCIYRDYIIKNISSSLRNYVSLWNAMKEKFTINYAGLVYKLRHPEIMSDTYDILALFTKGLLLQTELDIKKIIAENADTTLIKKYDDLQANWMNYNSLIESPQEERLINIDSLSLCIQAQEKELDSVMGFSMYNLKIGWKDIQQKLKANDIAIELLDIPIQNDSVMYVALTVRKDSEAPKMTALFEGKQLKEVPDTLYYQCKEMTDLVWKPLLPELEGIKNIYFSPSGALYNIGIEYLPGMEDYNIYRLSSTRELVTNKKQDTENSAVLYGGLDYYAKPSWQDAEGESSLPDLYVEHADVRGMGMRGGKEILPQTKVEVEQIGKELNEARWQYQLLTGDKGTEESFKALNGKRTNSLHISTHGFYYTPEEADKIGYDFLRLDNRMVSPEDEALTRSGLIMSGANHILEGEELPDNVEDGILTAKEIANVDLRGLDLVVLSACQTGLGDISQGEGVFGLQRGFKKAGANTILMSLWEVNDEATQILMTRFYKNLVSGQTKRQSLLSAQKYLREFNNGQYNEPKYWAAFILLDGIENKGR